MKVDESVLFELTGEKEVFNIPQKLMKMLLDETERKHLISELEKYEHGISCSFQEFFESEIADRKTFKQDYTPQSIGEICSNIVGMGSPIGVMVTLRDGRAYEFLDRLANVDLPRVRDFHGVSAKGFDKSGNFNLGITDQSVFPELTFEETQIIHGLQVTIVISGGSPANSRALLEKFGIPFEKQGGAA